MAIVAGVLKDSGDQVIPKARLTITLTGASVDIVDDPDSTLLPIPAQYIITNGALNTAQRVLDNGTLATAAPIDLLPTFQFGVQYEFRLERSVDVASFYLQDGTLYNGPAFQHTDNKWYTGSEFVSGVSQLLTRVVTSGYTKIDDFAATIQPSPAIQEYSLLRKSGLTSTLDDSLYLVLEQFTTNPVYLDRLSGKFNVRGIYDPDAFYAKNDVVVSGSILATYINASSTAGNAPPDDASDPDTAYWAKLPNLTVNPTNQSLAAYVSKAGATMTGALLLPAWGSTPDPATAVRIADGDVRYLQKGSAAGGVDQTIYGNIATSAGGSWAFNGTAPTSGEVTVKTQAQAQSGLRAANCDYVRSGSQLIVHGRRTTAQALTSGAVANILWDSEILDPFGILDIAGGNQGRVAINASTAGSMRLEGQLEVESTTANTSLIVEIDYTVNGLAAPAIARIVHPAISGVAPRLIVPFVADLETRINGDVILLRVPATGTAPQIKASNANSFRIYKSRR